MKSIHFKLFARYAILIISITAIFMTGVYVIWGNNLRSNATGELQADCDNITTLLDTQMDQIDQLSKRIVSSGQLKELFMEDLYTLQADAHSRRKSFSDAIFDIIKLSFNNMELNMFDTSGRYINIGMNTTYKMIPLSAVSELPWLDAVLSSYGKKVILPPGCSGLNNAPEPMVSLCRSFAADSRNDHTAVLEIQIKHNALAKKIRSAIHNAGDKKNIYIYNENGSLIYTSVEEIPESSAQFMKKLAQEEVSSSSAPSITRVKNKKPILLSHKYSGFTGWTIFVAESEYDLLTSFRKFQMAMAAAVILFLMITLFITYRIASSLSTPLRKLEQITASLTLDNLDSSPLPEYKSKFTELDSLYHSFDQMKAKLQFSLDDVVSARTLAVEAKMMALQSQMNPHFLYNTLSSISILAEEQEDEKIIKICDDLSLLLRYISSGTSRNVTLGQELEHTRSFINLIKIKYEERIRFHIHVDDALLNLRVPKLIVQPLVENSVKYGLDVEPPWIINVDGYTENGNWIIRVQDNGPGFSSEYLEDFQKQVSSITAQGDIPDLSINGMGLLNLYIRLWLLDRESMIFEVENVPTGGARVTIGGPLSPEQKEQPI